MRVDFEKTSFTGSEQEALARVEINFQESILKPTPKENILLKKAGFNSSISLTGFHRNLNQELSTGKSIPQALEKPLQEIKGDVLGYKLEYLLQEPLLPNPIEFREYRGKTRVFNKFSNRPLSEGILAEERDGAVLRTIPKIEDFLLTSPEGSLAAMVSPAGPSGLKDTAGREIKYPDTQIYMWYKGKDNALQSFTLVLDEFGISECLSLLSYLGLEFKAEEIKGLTQKDLLTKIIDNPFFYKASPTQQFRFEDIIKTVQYVKKSDIARFSDTPEGIKRPRTFNEVYQSLERGEDMLKSDKTCEDLISAFQSKLAMSAQFLHNPEVFEMMQLDLEMLIINIYDAIQGKKISSTTNYSIDQLKTKYAPQIRTINEIAGCAGGGVFGESSTFGIFNGITWRNAEITTKAKTCPHCNFKNTCYENNTCNGCKLNMEQEEKD